MPTSILMPALSPTMESGTLSKWHKKEGDPVAPGDVLAEIETDKATMEVEAIDEGRLAKILVAEGTEEVAVNAPIAVLLEEGEDEAALEGFTAGGPAQPVPSQPPPTPEPSPQAAPPSTTKSPAANGTDGIRLFASPLAKRLASQNNINIDTIAGSGPHGRIVKRDVEAVLASPQQEARSGSAATGTTEEPRSGAAATGTQQEARSGSAATGTKGDSSFKPIDVRALYEAGSYTEVPADAMRKTIARRLTQSFQEVPHFPLTVDCELDALLAVRKNINANSPQGDGAYKISVNDFIIKAAAMSLIRVPDANASWAGDAILKHHHADIGVAVAIDGGLITPIVKAADEKGLATISAQVKDLATRARERKLQPHEYQGGTFTVSNLGMFGIKTFASIVNQPQGAIMSVGAGEQRPVVKDGALAIATVMSITLTCDHRSVDGVIGAQFLQAFKVFIEEPASMML